MFFYLTALLILLVDQGLKYFVNSTFFLGQSFPLVGNLLKLTYIRNTGAAFSLFVGFSSYLAVVAAAVAIGVVYYYHKTPAKSFILQCGLAALLGGSLGNLVDRFSRGYVIDYLELPHWPVFNLADMMINLGVLLLFINFFLRPEKRR